MKKNVLITGASSGIGLSTAKLFFEKNYNVLLSGRNQSALDNVKSHFNDNSVSAYKADVSKVSELEDMYFAIAKEGKKIDCLVINAGIAEPLPFELVSEESFNSTVDVNFKGAFFTLQKALPVLADKATVVFVTSIANQIGFPKFSVYGSTKSAIRSLVKTVGLELIDRGIRVNAVSPGPIKTPMPDKFGIPKEEIRDHQKIIEEKSPIKRYGQPEEVAKAIYFLSIDDSSYIVGDEIVVDGGMTLL